MSCDENPTWENQLLFFDSAICKKTQIGQDCNAEEVCDFSLCWENPLTEKNIKEEGRKEKTKLSSS